jgi:hypothetical protein
MICKTQHYHAIKIEIKPMRKDKNVRDINLSFLIRTILIVQIIGRHSYNKGNWKDCYLGIPITLIYFL